MPSRMLSATCCGKLLLWFKAIFVELVGDLHRRADPDCGVGGIGAWLRDAHEGVEVEEPLGVGRGGQRQRPQTGAMRREGERGRAGGRVDLQVKESRGGRGSGKREERINGEV
eukprot:910117-Pleurochrysis_carterae.AAC.1